MPSINLDLDYFGHPKTGRLIRLLGRGAEVIPVRMWCWCARHYSETGVLTAVAAQEIETAVKWWGKPGKAVEALQEVGFLDLVDGNFVVHDWLEHSGHIAVYKRRAKAAAKARWKNASSMENDASSNASSNASPLYCKKEETFQKRESLDSARATARFFETSPPGLSDAWCFHCKRTKNMTKVDQLEDMTPQFEEWLKVSTLSGEEILKAIVDAGRDHGEYFWQFKKRLESGPRAPKMVNVDEMKMRDGRPTFLSSDGVSWQVRQPDGSYQRVPRTPGVKAMDDPVGKAARAAEAILVDGMP